MLACFLRLRPVRAGVFPWLLLATGCGLTLDLEPEQTDSDAGVDASRPGPDLGPPGIDQGPPGACESDDECAAAECTTGACVAGACQSLPLADGTRCSAGICRSGLCAPATCGDGLVDEGELCDDGNDRRADGCEPDCLPTCDPTMADSCSNGIRCDGAELCLAEDDGRALCASGAPPLRPAACAECDPATGGYEIPYIDADGDGYPLYRRDSCEHFDCNDSNSDVNPGAFELADDALDSDCDGDLSNVPTNGGLRCWLDEDGDGFGDPDAPVDPDNDTTCPTRSAPVAGDCDDGDALAHPDQTEYFGEPHCEDGACSYDWNCDGREERRDLERAICPETQAECESAADGWAGLRIPACGESALVATCQWTALGCVPTRSPEPRVQQCR